MGKNKHAEGVLRENQGRNLGLRTDTIRKVLYLVGVSTDPILSGEIARNIRIDEDRKMSNEYKIIKRLSPSNADNSYSYNINVRRFILKVRRKDGKFGYVLNLRGLLLYLYNEYMILKPDTKIRIERESSFSLSFLRRNSIDRKIVYNSEIVKRVKKVISNPVIVDKIRFLRHSDVFEKNGFDVVGLLFKISIELQNQLHIDAYQDTYLLRRATERYFIALGNFYDEIELLYGLRGRLESKEFEELREVMNDFRELITPIMEHFIELELDRLNFIKKLSDDYHMLKELDDMVKSNDKIIAFESLLQKYKRNFENPINFLDTVKQRRYQEYVAADYYLVSRNIVEGIKSNLPDTIKFPEVIRTFSKYNIPRSCARDLMEYLNYEEKGSKLKKENEFETGAYITFVKKSVR